MQISPSDIGEVVTVVIGFVLFYWVLKKFAWGPILGILDDRRKSIQDGFDEVKNLQAEAAETHRKYEEKVRDIEAEAREKINVAVADGKRVAAEMTEKARTDAAEIVEKARQSIALEIEASRAKLREEVIQLTLNASERLLRQKIDREKDRELVGAFIEELESR